MKLRERIIDHRIRQIAELDLVVVEKERVPEQYVAIIQDIHDTQTRVKTSCDTTEYFDIEVGLHQNRVCFESAILY